MTVLQQLLSRRGDERWALPIDSAQKDDHPSESVLAAAPYAIAAGLCTTLLGALVSIVVPGRTFLVAWALITLVASAAAGWEADRVRSAVRRLMHLSRTR